MAADGLERAFLVGLGVVAAQGSRLVRVEPGRNVAVEEVVRGGLVGYDVGREVARRELGQDLRRVPQRPTEWPLSRAASSTHESLVEVLRRAIQIALSGDG